MRKALVAGAFDDLRSSDLRFLQEAARLGPVTVFLWSDESIEESTGRPRFPLIERRYFLESLKFVNDVQVSDLFLRHCRLKSRWASDTILVVAEQADNREKREFCNLNGLDYSVITADRLKGFPDPCAQTRSKGTEKKVIVTGCYDWFHSGHIRFFEEVSELGELHVVVGHDRNISLLKGEGHPMFPQEVRRYMVASIRFVRQAYISSGDGWLDAEPEMEMIQPHIYAVNEDGDRPEKRIFCETNGIEYCVLKRLPKDGLPRRQSTDFRGF